MNVKLSVAVCAIQRFHMFDLSRQLTKLGHGVSIYTANPRFTLEQELRSITTCHPYWQIVARLKMRWLSSLKGTFWEDHSLGDFGRWLAKSVNPSSFDIIDLLSGPGVELGQLAHACERPWVCNRGSTHILTQKVLLAQEAQYHGMNPSNWSDVGLGRCLAEYDESDAIIVPSHFARQSFIDQGVPEEKVFVCPYGVDLGMFRREHKEDDTFRVIYVGAISLQKGVSYLLDAVRPLVTRRHVEVWFVGSITAETNAAIRGREHLFEYKGVVNRNLLSWYFSQASVLVHPSIQEGLALVQAQAMACGIPVIATTNTGAEDLFTSGVEGFIVPPRDSAAIRSKIEWMIDHPDEREEMGRKALERVKSIGGWDAYGTRAVEIYRTVIARYRGEANTTKHLC